MKYENFFGIKFTFSGILFGFLAACNQRVLGLIIVVVVFNLVF